MKKHPNAPPEKMERRKKNSPISLAEYDEIHRLWNSGTPQVDISRILKRSTGTVTNVIMHLTREVVEAREARRKREPCESKIKLREREVMDLSSLPDTALFEHTKEYIL